VVGGGPAGLAVALHARRAGLAVTVLDRAHPPIDKACGEGLMPDGVAALRALGVVVPLVPGAPAGGARAFHGIRYLDGEVVAEGRFPSPATSSGRSDGGVSGLGIRRTVLHRAMVERAEAVGVELLWGERAVGLVDERDAVAVTTASGRELRGRWLVGADGLLSPVRRWAGLESPEVPPAAQRFGVRRHFRIAARSEKGTDGGTDLVEVHWSDGCEAYVTPVGRETVGVAMLWRADLPDVGGLDDLLPRFPRLAERLAGASAASRDRGCGPLAQRVRAPARGRVALVGDASGYLDAITGEGLSLAFHQAEALVEAIARCERTGTVDLTSYARAHRRIRRLPEALIRFLLFVERRPALRRRVIRALAAEPALFDRILGIHARTLRPRDLGLGGALRLVGRMVG
jgi:flavin-dependent dehydrogenase